MQIETNAPTKSNTANINVLLEQARNALTSDVYEARLNLRRLLGELKSIGGKDSYHAVLLQIVTDAGPQGVVVRDLHECLPDGEKLKAATAEPAEK